MKKVFKKGVGSIAHTSVWLNDREWDLLGDIAKKAGKSRSAYIEENLLAIAGERKPIEHGKSLSDYCGGRGRSLAFSRKGLELVKAYAKEFGVSFSDMIRYFLEKSLKK